MEMQSRHRVTGIATSDLIDEYWRRGLDELSDARLVAAVGAVVARPRRDPADSFVLHAPLELAARSALLAHVAPCRRELARMHIVAIATQYEEFGPELDTGPTPDANVSFDSPGAPMSPISFHGRLTSKLVAAIEAGDLAQTDLAAIALASSVGSDELVASLADFVTPLTSAAAHAPIFLHQLLRADPRGGVTTQLLRPLARDLARNPTWRIGWIDDWTAERSTDVAAMIDAIATVQPVTMNGPLFIHPIMQTVDASGLASDRLGDVLGRYDPTAARAVLRCAAQSMLQDTPEHAAYGWTHCLTIPQAVLGIVPFGADPNRSLAVAATQVMAFRATLGASTIDPDRPAEDGGVAERVDVDADAADLATRAATSHDAHIVKYVLACFDAAADDPEATSLYLAAARRLVDVWSDAGGDPSDPLADSIPADH